MVRSRQHSPDGGYGSAETAGIAVRYGRRDRRQVVDPSDRPTAMSSRTRDGRTRRGATVAVRSLGRAARLGAGRADHPQVRAKLARPRCVGRAGDHGTAGAGRDGVRAGRRAARHPRALRHDRAAPRVRAPRPVADPRGRSQFLARAPDRGRHRAACGGRCRSRDRARCPAGGDGRRHRRGRRAGPVRVPHRPPLDTRPAGLHERDRADRARGPARQGVRLPGPGRQPRGGDRVVADRDRRRPDQPDGGRDRGCVPGDHPRASEPGCRGCPAC